MHDAIQDVLIVMLEEAGFQQVREEDVWWDVLATYHDKDHRRPDITCVDPLTNTTYILDVVIAWGETMGLGEGGTSRLANAKEAWKRRRYRRAFWGWTSPAGGQREVRRELGWQLAVGGLVPFTKRGCS